MCIIYVVSSVKHTPFISSTMYVYYLCGIVSQTHTVHFFNSLGVLSMWYRQSNTHRSFLQLFRCIIYVVSSVKHTPFISSTLYVYYLCGIVSQTHTVHFFNYVCVLCMWYRQSNTHRSFLQLCVCIMYVVSSVKHTPFISVRSFLERGILRDVCCMVCATPT